MNNTFEIDPHPGNLKILFIGLGASSHTHSWVDLLVDSKFNVRLFSVPGGGVPPVVWEVRTYICDPTHSLPKGLNSNIRRSFYPTPEDLDFFQEKLKKDFLYLLFPLLKNFVNLIGLFLRMPRLVYDYTSLLRYKSEKVKANAPDAWLAELIQDWQPDIIHTLGLFNEQGGLFYYNTRKKFNLEKIGTWVLQLNGGSDITLQRHNPDTLKQILDIFSESDQILTDNFAHIEYIKSLGFKNKIAGIAPVPGIGGLNIDADDKSINLPSKRQRMIYWPKAYESMWSKAMPILEAIKLAWDQIKPCTIYITATNNETDAWLNTLPEEIKKNCYIQPRIPREQVLEIMKLARVMIAPSLIDGLPNVLYEAMANGAFPILSPLDTITPVVSEPNNVLFARNLYPQEIADSLIKAMNDDSLVDEAARKNLRLVNKVASRTRISEAVTVYYESLFEFDKLDVQYPLVSVIIPFYNRIDLTIESVKSVLNQTYQNFEIILVNDGSKESLDALLEIKDPRIRILHQDNKGPAAARNHGMREAKGEFIAFLDSDDLFEPTKLMYQLKTHLKNPDVWFTHTSYRYFGAEGDAEVMHSGKFSGFVYPDAIFGCPIASPTIMFTKEIIEKKIYMEEKYRISEDIIFYFKIAKQSKIIGIDVPLTKVRVSPSMHAFAPQAQIAGSKNIMHYLSSSKADMTNTQRRRLFFHVLSYIGYNYLLLKNPISALYFYLQAFAHLDDKTAFLRKKLFSDPLKRINRVYKSYLAN